MIPKLNQESKKAQKTLSAVGKFASQGLRTMIFGMKICNDIRDDYEDLKEEEFEVDMELLGVSGVEDIL